MVTSGFVPGNNTGGLNSNIPELLYSTAAEKIVAEENIYDNVIKPKSSVDISHNQISNQDNIKQLNIIKIFDSGVEQNSTEPLTENQVQIVISTEMADKKPETTGRKYAEVQENNAQIINNSEIDSTFGKPETTSRKYAEVQENNAQIINNSEIDSTFEVHRDYSLLQSDGRVEKADLLTAHHDTFKENEARFTGKNHNRIAESNSTETSASYRKMIENPLPVDTAEATPVETKYIPIETKNITGTNNSTVEVNNSLLHVQGEIIENTGDGKTGTPQPFIDNSVKETEVIQNTEKIGNSFKVESEFRIFSETDNSGKSIERYELLNNDTYGYEKAVNSETSENIEVKPESMTSYRADNSKDSSVRVFNPTASKDNTSEIIQEKNSDVTKSSHVAGISKTESIDNANRGISGQDNFPANDFQENNGEKNIGIYKSRTEETTHYRNSNILQYSVGKKSINQSADNQENVRTEVESSPGNNLSLKTGETNIQNAFQQNPEFSSDRRSIQHFTGLENLSGDDIPETEMGANEKLFGIHVTSENSGKPFSVAGVENPGQARMYGDVNEEQILNSIVRQARFMIHKGQSSAVIKLEPPSLGKLRLDIVIENSRVTGRIIVESQEVKEIIQHSISELRENLAQNGLKVDSFDVQVGHNGGTDVWARMENFKKFMNNTQNVPASENNSNVSTEEQTIISKVVQNSSLYSEVIDIRI